MEHTVYSHAPLKNPTTFKLTYHAQQRLAERFKTPKGQTNFIQDNLNKVKFVGHQEENLEFWATDDIIFLLDIKYHTIVTVFKPDYPIHVIENADVTNIKQNELVFNILNKSLNKARRQLLNTSIAKLGELSQELSDITKELSMRYIKVSKTARKDQADASMAHINDLEDKVDSIETSIRQERANMENVTSLIDSLENRVEKKTGA